MIYFSFMPKINILCYVDIDKPLITSLNIFNTSKFPTINISNFNFLLIICIAKDFIWTALKAQYFLNIQIFFASSDSIFKQLYIGRISSYPNKPHINGKCIYSAFR